MNDLRYSHERLYRDRLGIWRYENHQRRETMQRTPVQSSNIASVGFDDKTKTMEIEFVGGGIYQYTGDPGLIEQRYKDLMAAESKGKFFTMHIRRDPKITVSRVG